MTLLDLLTVVAVAEGLLLARGPVARLLHNHLRRVGQVQPEECPEGRNENLAEDELLGALHDDLWPHEEWRAMELGEHGCPHPQLDGWPTEAAARGADARPHAVPRRCVCGQWHVYLRRRRHWRAPLGRRNRR